MSAFNKSENSQALEPAWEALKRELEATCAQSARTARRQIIHEFNQFFRRLRQYESEAEWFSAVAGCAAEFASEIAVFAVGGGRIELRAQRNMNLPGGYSMPSSSAGAFAGAIESKDPMVALRSRGEVGEALATGAASERVHLFPVTNGSRVVAILFAAGEAYVDGNALEFISNLGSAALERRTNPNVHTQIAPAARGENIEKHVETQRTAGERSLASWADLGEEERSRHIKAERFSRVAVAEMQLFKPEACRAGLEQNNLYLYLKKEIDKARETYRKRFLDVRSMVDYLHLELVKTAAEGDELKLGAEYPGPLV